MDWMTTVMSGLTTGAIVVGKSLADATVKDLYGKLKKAILAKRGEGHELDSALEAVTKKPESKPRQDAVIEELQPMSGDETVLIAARELVAALEKNPDCSPILAGIRGDGNVVAQNQGVAIGGDAEGNVIVTGSWNVITVGDVYRGPRPKDADEAIRTYLQVLAKTGSRVLLRGVAKEAGDSTGDYAPVSLTEIYVDLNTTTSVLVEKEAKKSRQNADEKESRPMTAVEAVAKNRRMVLLGDPGGGKSTFMNYLAVCLAGCILEPGKGWSERIGNWPSKELDLLPLPMVLRDFARHCAGREQDGEASPCHLWEFVAARLKSQNLEEAVEPLKQALDKGKAVLLLDGLDEVPTRQRGFVRDAIVEFADRHAGCRMVVTCRTLSYQDPEWRLDEEEKKIPSFQLALFDEKTIDRFVGVWYRQLFDRGQVKTREESELMAGRLREAVRRKDLRPLAANPLLLTVMALVHTHKGRLPDARALLYEETMDLLLWRWAQTKQDARLPEHLKKAERNEGDLLRVLWKLAFEAHERGGTADVSETEVSGIGELDLLKSLVALHPQASWDWAKDAMEMIRTRAGLLVEREPGVFAFPHRTFQEYLAGAHLSVQSDFAQKAVGLHEQGSFWRVAILLAVGRLAYVQNELDKARALLGELCAGTSGNSDSYWRRIWIAGDAVLEAGRNRIEDSAMGKEYCAKIVTGLVELVNRGSLNPVERAAAGKVLGRLGDPRPGVGLRKDGLPDIDWIRIPAGPFKMGDEKKTVVISEPYWIARYPVTVAQYGAFVEADGYGKHEYWTEAGWTWREKEDVKGPVLYGEPFEIANHPQVGVSWYEAMAFCRWLTTVGAGPATLGLGSGQTVPDGTGRDARSSDLAYNITLPTEAQWERAARHTDGREYPWGDEKNVAERCNMSDTKIGRTSPVGIFPNGRAECGAEDMAGNVWEWCQSRWSGEVDDIEATDTRVVRGNSFGRNDGSVRCAYRRYDFPFARGRFLGFRCMASSFSSPSAFTKVTADKLNSGRMTREEGDEQEGAVD